MTNHIMEDAVIQSALEPTHSPCSLRRFRRTARGWAIAALAAGIGAATLSAQAVDSVVPLPHGGKREFQVERQGGGPDAGDSLSIRAYRWQAPIEPMYRYFLSVIGGTQDAPLDTSALSYLKPGGNTPITYHVAFHTFEDQCADPVADSSARGATPATCKTWRRAKNKRRALGGRLAAEPGAWIERATWVWFGKDARGDVVRWEFELSDTGVSDNWQHYTPSTQLRVERRVVRRRPAP